jgi:large subunit ribosomal protein L9
VELLTVIKTNNMQVILIKNIDTLGGANELVTVKNGYARNYLIPKGMAVEASPSNMKQMQERAKVRARKEHALLAELNNVISVLTSSPLRIGAKTGTSGKIFGSVTSIQLANAIKAQKGYDIDRRRIHIQGDVKELGTYKASIDFGNGNQTEVEFEVVAD